MASNWMVWVESVDGRVKYTVEAYHTKRKALTHSAKLNHWYTTHGQAKFAYVEKSKEAH